MFAKERRLWLRRLFRNFQRTVVPNKRATSRPRLEMLEDRLAPAVHTNSALINLPDNAIADTYPSTIDVSGETGTISAIKLTLNGVSEPRPDDLDMLLVGPGGQTLVFLSDAGGNNNNGFTNVTITFDDASANVIPDDHPTMGAPGWDIASGAAGNARPAAYGTVETGAETLGNFPAPAPTGVYNHAATSGAATFTSVFDGTTANGTWSLYIKDDSLSAGMSGSISGGWSLDITSSSAVASTTTLATNNPESFTTGPDNLVTFTAAVTSGGNPVNEGTVTFVDTTTGATLASSVPVVAGQAQATNITFAAEGDHIIQATYSGTANFGPSNDAENQRVDAHTTVAGNTFTNPAGIDTVDNLAPADGTAIPYPSRIFVSGLSGLITDVNVVLNDVTHARPKDLDFLLVGPAGQTLIIVSDVGDPLAAVTNVDITLDDAAAAALPDTGTIISGTYKPTNHGVGDSWPGAGAPAALGRSLPPPAVPYGDPAPAGTATLAGAFNGADPNGAWRLYVFDDVLGGGAGTIGSWSLVFTTVSAAATSTAIVSSNNPSFTTAPNDQVTFTATVTSGGSPVTEGTVTFTNTTTGAIIQANVPLSASGQAQTTTSFTTEGTRAIQATYNATINFATSSGTVLHEVNNHTTVNGNSFSNDDSPITINDNVDPFLGLATPYPSKIFVAGLTGVIDTVTVQLAGVTEGRSNDVDILLVGPGGQKLILVSDAGDNPTATSNVTVNFSDAAAGVLPATGAWGAAGTTVSSKPVNYNTGDVFAAPAPAAPYLDPGPTGSGATLESAFDGADPNGTWSLFVVDDAVGGGSGSITSWTLSFVLKAPIVAATKSADFVPGPTGDADADGVADPGERLRYTVVISNTGNAAATGVTFTDTPGLNTSLIVGSVTTTAGTVTSGNSAGNTSVGVDVGTVDFGAGNEVTVTFDVLIASFSNGLVPASVSNQGTVAGSNFATVLTDDPGAGGTSDPTVTTLDTLTLGGTVWNDNGAVGGIAQNGIKDGGEPGIDGVALSLFVDANDDNTPDTPGTPLATTTTSGGGDYSFTGLAPGNYIVGVDQANFNAGGALFATQASPITAPEPIDPDNDVDNDDNGARVSGQPAFSSAITLAYNTEPPPGIGSDTNNTLDFGFVANQPPVAANVGPFTGAEDQAARITVTLSGTDPDVGDAVDSFTIQTLPDNGSLFAAATGGVPLTAGAVVPATGSGPYTADVFFLPNADWNGSTSFTYTAFDGVQESAPATASITVTAVADIADDTATTDEDTPVNILVLGNDTFEGTPAITGTTNGTNGATAVNNNGTPGNTADDFVVYTPNADFNGTDSFSYTVTSGGVTETATANVTINAVVDIDDDTATTPEAAPVSILVLANDTFEGTPAITATTNGASGTTAVNNNGTPGDTTDDFVVYTPTDPDFFGPDTFTYTVTSGGVTETANVSVTVTPVNDPAIITGDTTGDVTEAGGVNNGTPGVPTDTGDLDSTDVDNPNDAWTVVPPGAATLGGHGTYEVTATGVWTYTLDDNDPAVQALLGAATLTDTFNAATVDGATQLVTITIHAQNDAPSFAGLDDAPTAIAGGAPVVLDDDATISDPELTPADNFDGSILTLARQGGASAADIFGGSGTLTLAAGNVVVGAITVGTFTNAGGTLTITFNPSATSALVNSVLQQITYTTPASAPSGPVPISFTFDDGGGLSATGTITVTVQRQVDLVVSKTDTPDPVIAGSGTGNLTYTITVTNAGPSDASGVVIGEDLTLPAGVTFVSATPSVGTFVVTTAPDGTWNVGDLAAGANATLTVIVTVGATTADGATVSDTATVTAANETRINTSDDSATETTTVARNVDLVVTKTESIDPVIAGSGAGNLTYTITVTNAGPSDASGVVLAEDLTLPAGVTFVSATPSVGTFVVTTAPDGTWNLGDLAAGGSATLTVVLTASSTTADGATISDTATVSAANETLINPLDDSATATTAVIRRVDIVVAKTESIDPVVAGSGTGNLTYTITVTNAGPSDATGIVIGEDLTLPAGVTFVSATPSVGTFVATTAPDGTWTVGDLAAGASATLTVTLTAGPSAAAGTDTISDTATVTAVAETQTSTTNDSVTVSTSVVRQADLAVTKSGPPSVAVKGTISYTVTITNLGPSAAQNVVLSDLLPAQTTFVSQSQTSGPAFTLANSGNQITDTIPSLLPGESASFTFVVTARFPAKVRNTAQASSADADPQAANNSAAADTTIGNKTQRLVGQAYRDLLKREVNQQALANWTNFLSQPGDPAALRLQFTQAILSSQEYRTRAIQDIFLDYLGREAGPTTLQKQLAVLNGGGTFEQVRVNLLGSNRYFQASGGTNAAWATALYQDVLGRTISPAELNAELAALGSGATRGARAALLLGQPAAQRRLVRGWYQQFLRRAAEPAGLNNWVNHLRAGQRDEFVIGHIVASPEYFSRV
jgi:uncharacterized repeat protein (TIGR01451 family)